MSSKKSLLQSLYCVCIVCLAGMFVEDSSAAIFSTFDPVRHERYLGGAPNPNFLLDENQITGLGGRSALITPQHILTADHAGAATPSFRGTDGVIRSYTVSSFVVLNTTYFDPVTMTTITAPSDIRISTLSAPISGSDLITPIGIYDGSVASLLGQQFNLIGINDRAGANIVDGVTVVSFAGGVRPTATIFYDHDTATNGGTGQVLLDEASLQGGDSGHQALIQIGGTVALLGAHFGIDTSGGNTPANGGNYTSFSSFLAPYLEDIDTIVAVNGQSITRITAVPEPSSIVALAGVCLVALRRRKKLWEDRS